MTSLHMQTMQTLLRGDTAQARVLAEGARRQGQRAGYADAGVHHIAQMIEILEEEDPDLRPLVERSIADTGLWQSSPIRLAMLARLTVQAGREQEARRLISRLAM